MVTNDIKNELSVNFIEYAVACNTDRSIPDARSGLKPVAKRILWTAYEKGYASSKPHVKSARIVGDTMSAYHPHGDSSIYGAMVRLSQPWVMRYPLIDWHGSNGTQSGDGPAAARYTEARLAKISEDGLLAGIKKKNVDFILNYDETLEEPVTLPAIFPNLLCNPNKGIGVAIASGWACHNLREVAESIKSYVKGEKIGLPGPDFPTGGIVINKDDIPDIMNTGHGSVKIRGRYKIEDNNKIIFYEIPYGETIEELIAQIGKACDDKVIDGIDDVHDESNKKGLRIVITIDKGIKPEAVVNQLFAKTNLQSSFSYNQVALVDKTPTELNLYDCFDIYIKHNKECLLKELTFDINKAKARKEIVDGLLKALVSIDDIIALIKKSESSNSAKESLIKTYDFSELQAKAILAMRLSSLAKLEGIELEKERAELDTNIQEWTRIVNSQEAQLEVIVKKLDALVDKYGDDRRTELTQIDILPEKSKKKEIVSQEVMVHISTKNEIKRIPIHKYTSHSFKITKENTKAAIKTNTTDYLLLFSNKGKMYKILVDKIPETDINAPGTNLNVLLKIQNEEIIQVTASSLHQKNENEYAVFFTKNGLVKKSLLSEYTNVKRLNGIQAIKFKELTDSLVNVCFITNEDLVIVTHNGFTIKFNSIDIRDTGRITCGVCGIKLEDKDYVVTGLAINKQIKYLVYTLETKEKEKVPLTDIGIQQIRGGKGISNFKSEVIAVAAL